jgi:hypothetical protein
MQAIRTMLVFSRIEHEIQLQLMHEAVTEVQKKKLGTI